jgi:hypothetical protein
VPITKKKIFLAGALTSIAATGIFAAFLMMLTGDPYTGFFGLFTYYGSAIVGAAADHCVASGVSSIGLIATEVIGPARQVTNRWVNA